MPFKKGHKKIGGKKKGSKHKKTIARDLALKKMCDKILEVWNPLIEKKIDLAMGVLILKPVKVKGVVVATEVYQEKPDSQSLEYLFSMVVGKPKERMEIEIPTMVNINITGNALKGVRKRVKTKKRKKKKEEHEVIGEVVKISTPALERLRRLRAKKKKK